MSGQQLNSHLCVGLYGELSPRVGARDECRLLGAKRKAPQRPLSGGGGILSPTCHLSPARHKKPLPVQRKPNVHPGRGHLCCYHGDPSSSRCAYILPEVTAPQRIGGQAACSHQLLGLPQREGPPRVGLSDRLIPFQSVPGMTLQSRKGHLTRGPQPCPDSDLLRTPLNRNPGCGTHLGL